jgi:photosystem II stability/assembly factor-like uncharacterized protein
MAVGDWMILRTSDGGKSWNQITVPSEINTRYRDVAYFVNNNALIVGEGGVLIKTSDNGYSWTKQNSGTINWLNKIIYNGDNSGFIVGENNTILYTHDGGLTWTRQNSPAQINSNLSDVSFVNSNTGFVVSTTGEILKTTNSGKNWVLKSFGSELSLRSVDVIDDNTVTAVGYGIIGNDLIKHGRILHSTDGGQNWFEQNLPPDIQHDLLYSVHFRSATKGLIAGDGGEILTTTNGGTTWIRQKSGVWPPLWDIVSDQNKISMVGGNGIILRNYSFPPILPVPAKPTLKSPADLTGECALDLTLSWNNSANASYYTLQVSKDSLFNNIVVIIPQIASVSKILSNLENNTRYFWRVQAANDDWKSSYSEVRSFTTIIEKPNVPTSVFPLNNSENQPINLAIKWNKSLRGEYYYFQLSKDPYFVNLVYNDSTLTDTVKTVNLANSTKYFWRVRAKNIGGSSYWSNTLSFTTIVAIPDIPKLASPKDNAINVPSDLTLRWNKSSRTEKYILQLSPDSTFTDLALTDSSVTDTLRKVSPLIYDMRYYWRVKARNFGGESEWSETCTFKTIISAPNYPYLYQPVNNTINQPIELPIRWQRLKDAEKYYLQISTLQNFSSFVINDSTLTDTLKQVSGLNNNTIYFWRVRALNLGGISSWSDTWSFKTIVALPTVPVLTSPSNGVKNQPVKLKLTWSSVLNADTYRAMVSQDTLFTNIIIDDSTLTTPAKDISSLKYGMKYYWKVRAKNIANVSSYSPVWNFTTILPTPEALNAAAYGIRKVKLSWTDKADNESGFILERNTDKEVGYKLIDTLKANVTNYIDSTVSLATTYIYRLKAFTQFATSEYTAEASVTTLTSVADLKGIPTEYALIQNFPNPFNPSTVIRYSLPTESKVRIAVFNSLGQTVNELVNNVQPGGYYEEVFNAGNLPSGIYIYSIMLQSTDGKNNYSSVKKMILLK